jgi:hypothetical protein
MFRRELDARQRLFAERQCMPSVWTQLRGFVLSVIVRRE